MSAGSFTGNLHVLGKRPQARIYVSSIGRFSQPDSIVPGFTNPQYLNRYAYVLNSPIIFADPSGHKDYCSDVFNCRDTDIVSTPQPTGPVKDSFENSQGTSGIATGTSDYIPVENSRASAKIIAEGRQLIAFTAAEGQSWTNYEMYNVSLGAIAVANAFAGVMGTNSYDAWNRVFGGRITFYKTGMPCDCGARYWGGTVDDNFINVYTGFAPNSDPKAPYNNPLNIMYWAIHEIGHDFDRMLGNNNGGWLYSESLGQAWFFGSVQLADNFGLPNAVRNITCRQSIGNESHELFADAFLGWVVGGGCALGGTLNQWFSNSMYTWLGGFKP